MKLKGFVLALLGLLLALVGLVWVLVPAGSRQGEIRSAGDTMRVGDKFATLVVVLRPTTLFDVVNERTRYGVDLVLHEVADVSRFEVVPIVMRGEEMKLRNEAKLFGADGRRVWLYADTLVGIDLSTKQRVGFEELSRANPSLAKFWVEESKFYSVGGNEQKLRVKVGDARQFELDPGTLVARAYEEEKWAKAKDSAESQKQWAEYNEKMSMFGVGPEVFFWKGGLGADGSWFGLMSREEAGKVEEFGAPSGRAIRGGKTSGLWKVSGKDATRVCEVEYLDAGLLREVKSARPLKLEGPEGYLVMHQSRLGKDGTLLLTRVDMSGKKLWEVNTGIGKLDQVLPDSKHLGLVGDQPKVMIGVDLVDGRISQEEFSLTPMK
ncbi:MAG: hypothetical protein NTW74_10540 [Acidobacteria bacterium]|nr:hypothetical protein [Acidobacteriota bacterium]